MFQVEPCCWSTYSTYKDTKATLAILDKLDVEGMKLSEQEIAHLFGYEEEYARGTLTRWQRLKPRIWAVVDEPYSSTFAKYIACLSILFICLSVLSFCLKTNHGGSNPRASSARKAFYYIEHVCNAWFALEIIIRCLVSLFLPIRSVSSHISHLSFDPLWTLHV